MDTADAGENRYALVVCERNTGIVLNPKTFERWTVGSGEIKRLHSGSLEQARHLAAEILALRADLEVVIIDNSSEFVERIEPQTQHDQS
jgi:hypothetical protein